MASAAWRCAHAGEETVASTPGQGTYCDTCRSSARPDVSSLWARSSMDRASEFYSECCGFKSYRARQFTPAGAPRCLAMSARNPARTNPSCDFPPCTGQRCKLGRPGETVVAEPGRPFLT